MPDTNNNRDAFMLNLVESQYVARTLFQEWHATSVPRPPRDGELRGTPLSRAVL